MKRHPHDCTEATRMLVDAAERIVRDAPDADLHVAMCSLDAFSRLIDTARRAGRAVGVSERRAKAGVLVALRLAVRVLEAPDRVDLGPFADTCARLMREREGPS